MAIQTISRDWGVDPAIVRITATNTLAEVAASGYITAQEANIEAINSGVWTWQLSDSVLVYASDGSGLFTISSDFTTLEGYVFSINVIGTPVVVGDFAVFQSTSGNLEDLGFSPSDATKTKVVMAGSSTVIGRIAYFTDVNGTVDDTAAAVTNAGNIAAGLSGTAGSLISFPGTAANGSLILAAVNAGGAFNTTISNTTMGQSTVYTLADIGASTGGIPVSTAPIKMKAVAKASAAGGAAAQSFTDAFCTTGSVVVGDWVTQANPATVLTIVPGNGSFVVTSDTDAGAGTFSYIITK